MRSNDIDVKMQPVVAASRTAVLAGHRAARSVTIVVAAVVLSLVAGSAVPHNSIPGDADTSAHVEYDEQIGTIEQRAELAALDQKEVAVVFEALAAAFSGVAEIRPGDQKAQATSVGPMTPILAQGWDRDHYWITASYADMSRGAIWAAVYACKRSGKVPPWLCQYAGDKLSKWARGWGSAKNHGVWGAVYPYRGRLAGGRW